MDGIGAPRHNSMSTAPTLGREAPVVEAPIAPPPPAAPQTEPSLRPSRLPLAGSMAGVVALAAAVLASRVPFLSAGYGVDPDAWRVVLAARNLRETGVYLPSRLPGYPLHEGLVALVVDHPLLANGASALASAVLVAIVAILLRDHGARRWVAAGVVVAAAPAAWVSSVTTMDYMLAAAAGMGALLAATRHRAVA